MADEPSEAASAHLMPHDPIRPHASAPSSAALTRDTTSGGAGTAAALSSAPAQHGPIPTGRIEVDLEQLAHNWRQLARLVQPAQCGAVVKANAYGLGADHVIPMLARVGCATFFIATPSEGEQARRLAPEAEIYALDGLLPGAAEEFAAHRILPALSTYADVEAWARTGASLGRRLPCALHIDTGLNRLGLLARETRKLAAESDLLAKLDVRLVMSHLACADNPAAAKNRDQLLAFETLTALFRGIPRSLAASDGLMLGRDYHFDLVRPGYALYGGQASATHRAPVSPVVTVSARILAINSVRPGETVGYAASWQAARPSRIATIAAGYADGVTRSASSNHAQAHGHVLIAGSKAPIVGRVSMDLITVDVTDIAEGALEHAEEAILYGPGLSIEEAGFAAGTIGYEVLTRLSPRFARVYLEP